MNAHVIAWLKWKYKTALIEFQFWHNECSYLYDLLEEEGEA